jgi:hypothetical protein
MHLAMPMKNKSVPTDFAEVDMLVKIVKVACRIFSEQLLLRCSGGD